MEIGSKRKRATNLTVDTALLEEARSLGLNLSQVFEAALAVAVRQRRNELWKEKNRAALDAYNEHVDRDGVFSDGLRSF